MSLWHRYAWVAYVAVFLGVIGHASSEFVSKLANEGVANPVTGPELSVWRFVLGGLGLLVLTQFFRHSRNLAAPFRTHAFKLIWVSAFGVTGAYLFFHWSLDYASVAQVATMTTTIPIWVAISNLVLNKQPISIPKIVTGAAAVLGVALLVTDGYLDQLAGTSRNLIGVLMAAATAALGSAYAVIVRPMIAEYGALRISALTMSLGGLGLWLLVGAAWGVWVDPFTLFAREPIQAGALVTIALYNTTITQFLWIGGLAAVPDITRGSYLFFLKPVIAAFLAILFLASAQPLSLLEVLAIIVITGSVGIEASWDRLARLIRGGRGTEEERSRP